MARAAAGGAAARACTSTPATWRAERDAVLFGEWFCVGRADDLGPRPSPARLAVRRRGRASRCWSPATRTASCTRRTTSAGTAARRSCPSTEPRATPTCAARALRCPYHSWTYDLDGRLLQGAAHRRVDDFDPAAFGLHPVGVETWGGFVFVHLTPGRARTPSTTRWLEPATTSRATTRSRPRRRAHASPTTSPPTTRCCSRTTTSATTAGRCTPS